MHKFIPYYCSEYELQTCHIHIYKQDTAGSQRLACFTHVVFNFNMLMANLYLHSHIYTRAVHFLYYISGCTWDGGEHFSS